MKFFHPRDRRPLPAAVRRALVSAVALALVSPLAAFAGSVIPAPAPRNVQFYLHSSQGYLGVDVSDITAARAGELKLKTPEGAEIMAVDHDAPAGKAGMKAHDVILSMNGETIEGVEQLRRMLRETPAGRKVSFVLSRDGQQQTMTVRLADRAQLEREAWAQHFSVPEPPAPSMTESVFGGHGSSFMGALVPNPLYVGAGVSPMTTQLAGYFGVHGGAGLLVESVDEQSPADAAGLKVGDVILKVNGQPLVSRNDWIKALRNNRGKQVQLTVMRNKQQQTLTMTAGQPRKKGELDPPLGGLIDPVAIEAQLAGAFDAISPEDLAAQMPSADALMAEVRPQLEQLRTADLAKMRQQMQALAQQMQANARAWQKQIDSPAFRKQMDELRQRMETLRQQAGPLHGMV